MTIDYDAPGTQMPRTMIVEYIDKFGDYAADTVPSGRSCVSAEYIRKDIYEAEVLELKKEALDFMKRDFAVFRSQGFDLSLPPCNEIEVKIWAMMKERKARIERLEQEIQELSK